MTQQNWRPNIEEPEDRQQCSISFIVFQSLRAGKDLYDGPSLEKEMKEAKEYFNGE